MQPANTRNAAMALASDGTLRAAINVANPALAKPGLNGPTGITVELSQKLADDLDVKLELVVCDSAAKAVEALKSESCDIAFMAVDPAREADFRFSDVYLTIEGVYGVWSDSAFRSPSDIDQAGAVIAATEGTAYTQFLARTLRNAELVTVPDGFKAFRDGDGNAVAGIREAAERFAAESAGVRIITPAFMEIKQAIAVRKALEPEVVTYINNALFS